MTEAVIDASVLLKWFRSGDGEHHGDQARTVRARYESGALHLLAPGLLWLELLNVAGRSWRWDQSQLDALVQAVEALDFEAVEPELGSIAVWTAAGLTAYDATYVAAAEQSGVTLITDDSKIIELAGGIATPLAGAG